MARASATTKRATHERLLEAAAREFARLGLERANIDVISLAAGCAKGTVYNYFSSKEELFLAVVEEACAQAVAFTRTAPEASAREHLRATLAAFCDWARANEAFARVLVRECLMGTPDLYARVISAEAPLVDAVERSLEEGSRRGELRDDVPIEVLALAIAGLVDLALVKHWASDSIAPTLDGIPELVLGLLLGPVSTAGTAS